MSRSNEAGLEVGVQCHSQPSSRALVTFEKLEQDLNRR